MPEASGVVLQDAGKVRNRLWASERVVILTGAGVSAESGVPTFRGEGGLWRDFRPEDLATPEAFQRDPVLVWEWYDWRRGKISSVRPNAAHFAIAEIEKRLVSGSAGGAEGAGGAGGSSAGKRARGGVSGKALPDKRFTLITQNVDGLHSLAGSHNVLEIHGSIWRVRCVECHAESVNRDVPIKIPPRCPCKGILRPAVVWFGEMLPEPVIEAAFEASSKADFMLVAGTSGVVQPAASLALRAKEAGAFSVEVNTEKTPLSPAMDVTLAGKAAEIIPGLL